MQNYDIPSTSKRPLLTVELSGGLANQLFQWSASKIIAAQNGVELIIDSRIVERPDARGEQISTLINKGQAFRHESPLGTKIWKIIYRYLPHRIRGVVKRLYALVSMAGKSVISENINDVSKNIKSGRSVLMRGLFQDSDFFYSNRDQILSNISIEKYIPNIQMDSKYAAMHIRRGDYVQNPKYAKMFGVCSEEYYRQALALLSSHIPIVIVTDDIYWAEQFVKRIDPSEHKVFISKASNHFQDLNILAGASELVLSNSTFSWWGAFMSDAEQIVCPDPWFSDVQQDWGLRRPDWIKVPR